MCEATSSARCVLKPLTSPAAKGPVWWCHDPLSLAFVWPQSRFQRTALLRHLKKNYSLNEIGFSNDAERMPCLEPWNKRTALFVISLFPANSWDISWEFQIWWGHCSETGKWQKCSRKGGRLQTSGVNTCSEPPGCKEALCSFTVPTPGLAGLLFTSEHIRPALAGSSPTSSNCKIFNLENYALLENYCYAEALKRMKPNTFNPNFFF